MRKESKAARDSGVRASVNGALKPFRYTIPPSDDRKRSLTAGDGGNASLTAGDGEFVFPGCHLHKTREEMQNELSKSYEKVASSREDGVLRVADLLWCVPRIRSMFSLYVARLSTVPPSSHVARLTPRL
jgi:hypothetical protein